MRRCALLALVLAAVLGGCAKSDIDTVKEQVMSQDSTYTFGQAFGTRKVCASTAWADSSDDRGRRIVEYRCTIKGVDDYDKAGSDDERNALQLAAQREKDRYLDDVKLLQASLADAKNKLASAHGAPTVAPGSMPMDPRSMAINESLAVLQSGNIDAILARDYSPYSEFNRAVAEYKAFMGMPKIGTDAYSRSRCCRSSLDPSEAANRKFQAARQAAVQKMQADLASLQQVGLVEAGQDLSYLSQAIQDYQGRLDRLTAAQASVFAAIDSRLLTGLAAIDDRRLGGVDEVFRWSISDRIEPALIYGGLRMHYRKGAVEDSDYTDSQRGKAVTAILQNQATDYTQFMQEPAMTEQREVAQQAVQQATEQAARQATEQAMRQAQQRAIQQHMERDAQRVAQNAEREAEREAEQEARDAARQAARENGGGNSQ